MAVMLALLSSLADRVWLMVAMLWFWVGPVVLALRWAETQNSSAGPLQERLSVAKVALPVELVGLQGMVVKLS